MKELTSLTSSHHVLDDFCYLFFIFFLSVLLIEDTVLLITKSDTAEAVGAIITVITIKYIYAIPA